MSKPIDTALMRRVAERVSADIITGHDWPNTQDELDRLQAAQLLRQAAEEIDGFATFARGLSEALNTGDGAYRP